MARLCRAPAALAPLALVPLSAGCDDPPAATQPAPIAPSADWSAEVSTPLWAWREDDGRVFVRFEWALEYRGSEPAALISAAEQRWRVDSSGGPFNVSTHPSTLNGARTSGSGRPAMFYSATSMEIPEWMTFQFTIQDRAALDVRLEPRAISTRGLELTLEERARYEPYAGVDHEADAELLVVAFTATNPTAAPVTFSPFDWTAASGGVTWDYHHRSTYNTILLVAPGEQISGVAALDAPSGSERPASVDVAYQGRRVGAVRVGE